MSDDIVWIPDYIPNINIMAGDKLDALISTIEHVSDLVKQGSWKDVEVEFDLETENFVFGGLRLETEKEKNKRIKEAERNKALKDKAKKYKEERERKQYELLKKKFEGKDAT